LYLCQIIMGKNGNINLYTSAASILLIAVYLLSYIGFSIHTCSCEESTQISILIGNPSCESLHTHIPISKGDFHHCDGHHHCDEHHNDGCCSTEVLVLTSEQTSPDHNTLFSALSSGLVTYFSYPDFEAFELAPSHSSEEGFSPSIFLRHCQSYLSVWRL
jgi:hypothetical protein